MKRLLIFFYAFVTVLAVKAAEPIDLNVTSSSYTMQYSQRYGDWLFKATDYTGDYIVSIDYYATEDGKCGTFSYSDLYKPYSYVADFTDYSQVNHVYAEGTYFTVSEEDGYLKIVGLLVCSDGTVFNLNVCCPLPSSKNIHVEGTEFVDAQYYQEDLDWLVRFKDDNYRIVLDLICPDGVFGGTFTESNAVSGYNFCQKMSDYTYDLFTKLNVTAQLIDGATDPNEAFEVTGSATGKSGINYTFHFIMHGPIKPKQTITLDVDLNKAEWPSETISGGSYFEVTDKADPTRQFHIATYGYRGELTDDDVDANNTVLVNSATGETYSFDNGTVTQTFDYDALTLNVDASLVMKDSIEYVFSFNYPITVQGEVSKTYSNLEYDNSYADWGVVWFVASDDSSTYCASIYNSEVPGEYDDDYASMYMIVNNEDGTSDDIHAMAILNAVSDFDDDGYPLFDAKFLGADKKIYNVHAYYVKPEIQDTLDINIDGLGVYEMFDSMDAFQIAGYNNDSTVYISLVPEAYEIPGHYELADLDTYKSYSFIVFIKPDGDYDRYKFDAADFDVTQDGDNVTLTGEFDADVHHLNMTLKGTIVDEEEDGIAQVEADKSPKTRKVLENGHIVIRKAGEKYSLSGQRLK